MSTASLGGVGRVAGTRNLPIELRRAPVHQTRLAGAVE
jgi:hypothetical protein